MASEYRIKFLDLLGLLFIGEKLAHKIDWSWWFVLAPLWIPFCWDILIQVTNNLIDYGRKIAELKQANKVSIDAKIRGSQIH